MDSLRYWVERDARRRLSLRPRLGAGARERHGRRTSARFFDIMRQDPVLSQVKLIAEPWDLGHGGYQVGNFPLGWAEWNDRYRDAHARLLEGRRRPDRRVRARGSPARAISTAARGKRPHASINFVTAHDGFTLHDLVSYNDKHNEANGEDNRDGNDNNLSWNCGVEGPDRRSGDQRAARAPEAQPARHAAAVAGRADAARRRRDRPHAAAATTTPTARTTRSAGSTGRRRTSATRCSSSCAA